MHTSIKIKYAANLILLLASVTFLNTPIEAQTTALYGLTSRDGQFRFGTMFKYYPGSNNFVKLVDFDSIHGSDPSGNLIQATDGNLYGLTGFGGLYDGGTIFKYNIDSNSFTSLYSFDSTGFYPFGSLVQFSNGKLYGTAFFGGKYLQGTIFSYDPVSGIVTAEYDFANTGSEPYEPSANLCILNGSLYGTASPSNIIEFNPVLDSFTSFYVGNPNYGSLNINYLTPVNNALYGIAAENPLYLFKFNPVDSSISTLYTFDPNFSIYTGELLLAKDGNMYGLSYGGAGSEKPWLYQYNFASNNINVIHAFASINDGDQPQGGLIQASDGLLYGMTWSGGLSGGGTIFTSDYSGNGYKKLYDLNSYSGTRPEGDLLEVIEQSTAVANVGINEDIKIYPDPASNQITIQMPGLTQEATLKVMDLTGRIVLNQNTSATNKFVLNIESLSAGAYLVELRQNNLIYTGKFVKMN